MFLVGPDLLYVITLATASTGVKKDSEPIAGTVSPDLANLRTAIVPPA